MTARIQITEAIVAAQLDREDAQQASDNTAFNMIFDEIVRPLNQQLARMTLHPKTEAEEFRMTLKILEDGLAKLASSVAASRVMRIRARADKLSSLIGTDSALPLGSVNPDIPDKPPTDSLDTFEPPPEGPPGEFIHARKTAPQTVLYVDAEGREMLRQGGSRSWRNNNPGNIREGSFAELSGAIGDDGAFAIFPDESVGFNAIVALLRSATYSRLTLREAIFRYAPPSENNSSRYVDFVTQTSQVDENAMLGDLVIAKIRAIANAIKKMEGWTIGDERLELPTSATVARAEGGGGITSAIGAAQEWMSIAEREAALPERERSEWPDPGENPRILEYFRIAAPWFEHDDGDEVDWCAAFVNFCLMTSGHIGTNHPGARSFFWNRKNQFVRLKKPVKGAIAVRRYRPFNDPKWMTGAGHVGFITSFTSTRVSLLGGNQSKTVCIQSYPLETQENGDLTSKFVAFMMPVLT
jgi:uncharacterized protein (TIGR02594 family)